MKLAQFLRENINMWALTFLDDLLCFSLRLWDVSVLLRPHFACDSYVKQRLDTGGVLGSLSFR